MLSPRARRLVVLLAALTALLLTGCADVTTTSGPTGVGVQNRVWALNLAAPSLARPIMQESACSRPGFTASTAQVTSGFCVAAEEGSAFDLAQFPRGLSIEADLGGNLPRSFPTIDRFENGVATSIKSIDLSAPTYSTGNALANRLTGYIGKVASFQGARFGGVDIAAGDITGRGLDVAVQQGAATPAQTAALDQAVAYGATRGVDVQVVQVP